MNKLEGVSGYLSDTNRETLEKYIKKLLEKKNSLEVVDIGSLIGLSSIVMASVGKVKVYSIEPNHACKEEFERNVKNTGTDCTLYEMTSKEFGEKYIPEEIDACFIDGVHTPLGVKVDIDLIASKVRKGGYIMFHDVNLYNLKPLIEIYEGKMFKFVEEEETEYLNGKPYGNIYVGERI